jgi:hypothetical protein
VTIPTKNIFVGGYPLYEDTFWEDLRFPATGINPPGLVSDPDVDTTDGTFLFDAGSTEIIMGVAQMPHSWKIGTNIHPHIHWSPTSTNEGDVLWRLEYQLASINSAFSGSWATLDVLDAGSGTDDDHLLASWAVIDMSGISGVSAIMKWRVSRIGGDASDTYTADAKLLEFDIHYEIDRPGSRQEVVK